MKELKNDLKTGQFKRIYLFHGEEKYLIQHYERQLRDKIVPPSYETMNLDIYNGKAVSATTIADACATLPFLNEYRLVVVRDSHLFSPGRKDETEKFAAFVPEIPDTTVLIFVEDSIDKRNRLYKMAAGAGRLCEFKTPSEKELTTWIMNVCTKQGKKISPAAASVLLRTVAHSMDAIKGELDKLIAYTGREMEIRTEDIRTVCTVSLEAKIFDLVEAVGSKKTELALIQFSNLLLMKEQPIMILSMIARQFRLILQSKILHENGLSSDEIASALSARGFVIKECLRQAVNFKKSVLLRAIEDCAEADMSIKTGRISDKLAVETLIMKYAAKPLRPSY